MIKFSGTISDENRVKVMKRNGRSLGLILMVISLLGFGVIATIYFLRHLLVIEILLCSILLMIASIVLIFMRERTDSKRFIQTSWDFEIVLDNKMVTFTNRTFQKVRVVPFSKIKKIIDEGNFYVIIFGEHSNGIVCQKNLIVEGSIEEFEKLFEGKIVRNKK